MKKKVMVALLLSVMSINVLGSKVTVSAAGCGNWQMSGVGTPYCTEDTSCGYRPPYENQRAKYHRQDLYWWRLCVTPDNKSYNEYKTEVTALGCCARLN